MSLPAFPPEWEWLEGTSSNGDVYLAYNKVQAETGIFVRGLDMDHWRLIERPANETLGRQRMKTIRDELHSGRSTIADLVPAPSALVNWGRF